MCIRDRIGGDLYTAYTFIAVPGFVYGTGPVAFYALPYTAIVYPLVFIFAPRFWTLAKNRGYITYADFARERYDSRTLALAVAVTGILATMPYIALQLVGIQVVVKAMGFASTGFWRDAPIIIAFIILAAYTYRGGLRAPALVAFVKDTLIYVTVIAAAIIIPAKLGGFGHIFSAAGAALAARPEPTSLILPPDEFSTYVTLALGSALAVFMYPHNITGVLSASGPKVIRRNMIALPLYSLLLTFIALLGYCALAAGIVLLLAVTFVAARAASSRACARARSTWTSSTDRLSSAPMTSGSLSTYSTCRRGSWCISPGPSRW